MDPSKCVYRFRLDALSDEVERVLQNLLDDRQKIWVALTGKDFFESHPPKKWNPDEKDKIDTSDIKQWDASLCIKWLMEFQWKIIIPNHDPHKNETNALKELRKFRNDWGHLAKSNNPISNITEQLFNENCTRVGNALRNLGVKDQDIKKIQQKASEAEFERTPWEYETLSILGFGSFGVVLEAKYKLDDHIYAVKIIPYEPHDDRAKTQAEAKNFVAVGEKAHSNIVSYRHSGEFCFTHKELGQICLLDRTNLFEGKDEFRGKLERLSRSPGTTIECLIIKMEVCSNTLREWAELQYFAKRPPATFEFRYNIAKQLIDALNYIHLKGILHRDLRPDNIFFAKTAEEFPAHIKIGDFGLSNQLKGYISRTMTKYNKGFNTLYRAPEMSQPHKEGAKYGKGVDLYAMGLILSEIFDPECSEKLSEKFFMIKRNRETGKKIKPVEWLNSLILQLTEEDDSKRYFRDGDGEILPISFTGQHINPIQRFIDQQEHVHQSDNLPLLPSKFEQDTHIKFLEDFRVERCSKFTQHECDKIRPFACFKWHYPNQRRRRPIHTADGAFNYSPYKECNIYDKDSGLCPNGDDCPQFHRNIGDTERKFHLRLYKTHTCEFDDELAGSCPIGQNCAFAHGESDNRSSVVQKYYN